MRNVKQNLLSKSDLISLNIDVILFFKSYPQPWVETVTRNVPQETNGFICYKEEAQETNGFINYKLAT